MNENSVFSQLNQINYEIIQLISKLENGSDIDKNEVLNALYELENMSNELQSGLENLLKKDKMQIIGKSKQNKRKCVRTDTYAVNKIKLQEREF